MKPDDHGGKEFELDNGTILFSTFIRKFSGEYDGIVFWILVALTILIGLDYVSGLHLFPLRDIARPGKVGVLVCSTPIILFVVAVYLRTLPFQSSIPLTVIKALAPILLFKWLFF